MGLDQKTIHNHLGEMPALAFLLNGDLSRGFTIAQVAQKRGWPDLFRQRKLQAAEIENNGNDENAENAGN